MTELLLRGKEEFGVVSVKAGSSGASDPKTSSVET
jgi:hypothetical protein